MTISKYELMLDKAKAELEQKKNGTAFEYQVAKAKVNYAQHMITVLKRASGSRNKDNKK